MEGIINNEIHIYPKFIESIIIDYGDIIVSPRKIEKAEELKVYHKYANIEFGKVFKVENIFECEEDGYTNYTIKFPHNSRYASISSPVHEVYEIIKEKDTSLIDGNIINSGEYYLGYKIKRWFFKRINEEYHKYHIFIPYIEYGGKNNLNDNRYYSLQAIYNSEEKAYGTFKFSTYSKR